MRTGLEITTQTTQDLEALHEATRLVGQNLVDAMRALPEPDAIPHQDRELVQSMRWSIAEALRLNRFYREQLVSRRPADPPGSATPGKSHYASLHDPPDAC